MKNWPERARSRARWRPPISIDVTPGPASTTRATCSPWYALRASGTSTRRSTSAPSVPAYSAIQYARARGRPTNAVPTAIWWLKASATPRYEYRWTKYHVS